MSKFIGCSKCGDSYFYQHEHKCDKELLKNKKIEKYVTDVTDLIESLSIVEKKIKKFKKERIE